MTYDVLGMCNPLFDIQAEVSDSVLTSLGLVKGSMQLIDEVQQKAIIGEVLHSIVNAEAGGSGANTMIGLAMLGGSACYTGKVANDEHGALYLAGLRSRQVQVTTPPGNGTTGISVILVSPDAERTMCTHLGICRQLSPADVDIDALRASRYLYVTGYLWDTDSQKAAVLYAMRTARESGVKVALSLSDPFCVQRHRDDFARIVRDHVDLVIGNDEEAAILTGAANAHDSVRILARDCATVVVTMGSRGSLLHAEDRLVEIGAVPVTAVDTTGAGDIYASAILYGLTRNLTPELTGKLAACLAGQIVSRLGPRLTEIDTEQLNRECPGWRN